MPLNTTFKSTIRLNSLPYYSLHALSRIHLLTRSEPREPWDTISQAMRGCEGLP